MFPNPKRPWRNLQNPHLTNGGRFVEIRVCERRVFALRGAVEGLVIGVCKSPRQAAFLESPLNFFATAFIPT
jgi:hypothetical protein